MRTYTVDGAQLPSVTSVLGMVWPKPELQRWKVRGVANEMAEVVADGGRPYGQPLGREASIDKAIERFEQRGERVKARGQRVHKWAEAQVLGAPAPELEGDQEEGMAKACLAWHEAHPGEIVASEMAVTNGLWAGTLDLIKRFEPPVGLAVCDYKTSLKHGSAFADQAAQVGGYSLCDRGRVGQRWQAVPELRDVQSACIVRLCPDGYDETWVNLAAAREAWQRAWEMYLFIVAGSAELWGEG